MISKEPQGWPRTGRGRKRLIGPLVVLMCITASLTTGS